MLSFKLYFDLINVIRDREIVYIPITDRKVIRELLRNF